MLINNGSNQNVEIPLGFLINDSGPLQNCYWKVFSSILHLVHVSPQGFLFLYTGVISDNSFRMVVVVFKVYR